MYLSGMRMVAIGWYNISLSTSMFFCVCFFLWHASHIVQNRPTDKHLSSFETPVYFRVVVITSGLTSFVFAKKYIDKRRLELIKAKGRERLLEAEKHAKNNS